MYKIVEPKSAFEMTDLQLDMYTIKPDNSESLVQLHNWFIISSMPGLNIKYTFSKDFNENVRYYKLTFDLRHNFFKLQNNIVVKWKLFILYDYFYPSREFVGAYKLIAEKTESNTTLEVFTSIDMNKHEFVDQLISNIKNNVLNINNAHSEKEFIASLRNDYVKKTININENFKVDVRVFSHLYLTNSEDQDLAHIIANIDSFLI
jgi:hypothetical protein